MPETSSRVKLLVLSTNFHHQDGKPLFVRLERECVRSPFSIKAKEGLYVRYENSAYLLYSPASTARLIKNIRINLRKSMSQVGPIRGTDISLALLADKYENHFHCVLERSPGHFHHI